MLILFALILSISVRLSKRRKLGPGGSTVAKSRLIVRHRPQTDQEIAAQVCSGLVRHSTACRDDVFTKCILLRPFRSVTVADVFALAGLLIISVANFRLLEAAWHYFAVRITECKQS